MGSIFSAALERTAERVGSLVGLGPPAAAVAILTLVGPLSRLRQEGLYDTPARDVAPSGGAYPPAPAAASPRSRGPCRR
jgi:hypothetical protein